MPLLLFWEYFGLSPDGKGEPALATLYFFQLPVCHDHHHTHIISAQPTDVSATDAMLDIAIRATMTSITSSAGFTF